MTQTPLVFPGLHQLRGNMPDLINDSSFFILSPVNINAEQYVVTDAVEFIICLPSRAVRSRRYTEGGTSLLSCQVQEKPAATTELPALVFMEIAI